MAQSSGLQTSHKSSPFYSLFGRKKHRNTAAVPTAATTDVKTSSASNGKTIVDQGRLEAAPIQSCSVADNGTQTATYYSHPEKSGSLSSEQNSMQPSNFKIISTTTSKSGGPGASEIQQ